jgi:hypothetical protein
MLRGNLATRPFYNERAVQVLLAVVGGVLAVLTIFCVWRGLALTAQQRQLSARIAQDERRAAALRLEAQRVRGRLDAQLLESTVRATREANAVIDERTFSWTALFNVIERTIPADVRLQAVTPSADQGRVRVRLLVNATRVEPVAVFLDRLEEAGAFADLRSVDEQALEDGSFNVACEGVYLGPGAPPKTPSPDAADPAVTTRGAGAAGGN